MFVRAKQEGEGAVKRAGKRPDYYVGAIVLAPVIFACALNQPCWSTARRHLTTPLTNTTHLLLLSCSALCSIAHPASWHPLCSPWCHRETYHHAHTDSQTAA